VKHLAVLGALAALTLSPSLALADAPVDPPDHGPVTPAHETLSAAAHDLTRATGQLAHLLAAAGPEDGLSDHAATLHEAAARFEEALAGGDEETLHDHFLAISRAFFAMRDALHAAGAAETPEVQDAWSQVTEIDGRLALAWYGQWARRHLPPRG
jgi:hypothetical protein